MIDIGVILENENIKEISDVEVVEVIEAKPVDESKVLGVIPEISETSFFGKDKNKSPKQRHSAYDKKKSPHNNHRAQARKVENQQIRNREEMEQVPSYHSPTNDMRIYTSCCKEYNEKAYPLEDVVLHVVRGKENRNYIFVLLIYFIFIFFRTM